MSRNFFLCASFLVVCADVPNPLDNFLYPKTQPLDVKSPIVLLSKRQSQELMAYNFGLDTAFSAGYDESYGAQTSFKSQVTGFDFKFLYLASPWLALNGKLGFDTSVLPVAFSSPPNFVNKTSNSRVVLSEGYVVFGDLSQSPWYGYWGQLSLPYGKNFAPSNATDLSTRMQQITQRPIAVGWSRDVYGITVNPEFFVFTGDSKPIDGSKNQTIGFTLNTQSDFLGSRYNMNLGWVSNVADTNGFQRSVSSIPASDHRAEFDYADNADQLLNPGAASLSTIFAETGGFATNKEFEAIHARIPASSVAVSWELPYGVTASSAYVTVLKSFDYRDLVYRSNGIPFSNTAPPTKNEGARPSAWNVYVEKSFDKGFKLHTGFEGTDQALGINLPRKRFVVGGSKKIDAFTKLEFEIKSDTNYSQQTDALGPARSNVSNDPAVRIDGQSGAWMYALSPSGMTAEGKDVRGRRAVDFVCALKIKF